MPEWILAYLIVSSSVWAGIVIAYSLNAWIEWEIGRKYSHNDASALARAFLKSLWGLLLIPIGPIALPVVAVRGASRNLKTLRHDLKSDLTK